MGTGSILYLVSHYSFTRYSLLVVCLTKLHTLLADSVPPVNSLTLSVIKPLFARTRIAVRHRCHQLPVVSFHMDKSSVQGVVEDNEIKIRLAAALSIRFLII